MIFNLYLLQNCSTAKMISAATILSRTDGIIMRSFKKLLDGGDDE